MKKRVCLWLVAGMLAASGTGTALAAKSDIAVIINGTPVAFDVAPQIMADRTMVPLRAVFEALGAAVDWDGVTQTVTGRREDTTIRLTIGQPTMTVNETTVALDAPAVIVNDRTLVPLRAISEGFDFAVAWDAATQTVTITPAAAPETPAAKPEQKPEEKPEQKPEQKPDKTPGASGGGTPTTYVDITTIQKELETQQALVEKLEAQIAGLARQKAAKEEALTQAREEAKTAETDKAAAEQALTEAIAARDALQEGDAGYAAAVETVAQCQTAFDAAQQAADEKAQAVTEQEAALEELTTKRDDLNAQREAAAARRDKLAQQVEDWERRNA